MSSITKVEIWDNPGYLEDGVEAPKLGAALTLPTRTYSSTYRPSVDRLLSELKLPVDYSTLRDATYLRVTIDMNNGSDQTFYGWVDSVEISSDTSGYAMTTIRWHVDLWRTYSGSASFGSGHVRRKPTGDHPLQGYEFVRRVGGTQTDLVDRQREGGSDKPVWWALLAHTITDNNQKKVVQYVCWPIFESSGLYLASGQGGTAVPTITAAETFIGKWDELLGISPEAVTGCWISPFFPNNVVLGSGTNADPFYTVALGGWQYDSVGGRSYFKSDDGSANPFVYTSKTITSATSTERSQIVLCGFDGEVAQEIPIGASIGTYRYRIAPSPTSMSIVFRFDGILSRAEGLTCTIPLPNLDLSENAWSEYVYSGEREYDIEMRTLQSLQSGVQSAAGGALNGAVMGGLGSIGAGAGVGLALAGAAASTAIDTMVFNPLIQEKTDRYRQQQSAGMLLSGDARDVFYNGVAPFMMKMTYDTYSESQASARDSQYGFAVDEFKTSMSSDLTGTSTGYWQVDGLVVGGSIPAEAKRYISRRFAAGVRLT